MHMRAHRAREKNSTRLGRVALLVYFPNHKICFMTKSKRVQFTTSYVYSWLFDGGKFGGSLYRPPYADHSEVLRTGRPRRWTVGAPGSNWLV